MLSGVSLCRVHSAACLWRFIVVLSSYITRLGSSQRMLYKTSLQYYAMAPLCSSHGRQLCILQSLLLDLTGAGNILARQSANPGLRFWGSPRPRKPVPRTPDPGGKFRSQVCKTGPRFFSPFFFFGSGLPPHKKRLPGAFRRPKNTFIRRPPRAPVVGRGVPGPPRIRGPGAPRILLPLKDILDLVS